MAAKDSNSSRTPRPAGSGPEPDPKPAGDPLPSARSAASDPEVQRLLKEAATRAAEDAIKASFDLRLNRLQEEVRRGLDRASGDILAQVRGSLEGKVLAALTGATSSKEFRGILQEITLWSANQALKERFAGVVKQAEEGLEARVAEAAASLAGTEAFRTAVAASAAAEAKKALEALFGADATGELARVVRKMVDEGQVGLLARVEERIETLTKPNTEVRGLVAGLVSDQAALLERLQSRTDSLGRDLADLQERLEGRLAELEAAAGALREEIQKAKAEAAGASDEGVEALYKHLQQVEAVVGSVQERVDGIEGERLRRVFEILAGMSGPKDLEAKIRDTAGDSVSRIVKTLRSALDEMQKKADEMVAAERAKVQAQLRELEDSRIAPLTAVLQGAATPGDLERKIREIALAAVASEGLSAGARRDLLDDPMVREKVKALAAMERRDARAEVAAQVEEALQAKGITAEGIPEGAIKKLVDQAVAEAVSSVKSLSKQIRPAIEVEVGKELKERLKDFLPAKEVRDLVETRLEQAKTDLLTRSGVMQAPAPAPDLESLRQKLAADLGRVLETRIRDSLERDLKRMVEAQAPAPAPGGGLTIDQVRETIKSLLGKEAIQESVQKIIQSDLFNNFLGSDQLKEMLDDKFKIMRNWLKNEELPRQLARNKEGSAPDA